MKQLTTSHIDLLWLAIAKFAKRHDNEVLALAIAASALLTLSKGLLETFRYYALAAGLTAVPVFLIVATELAARVRRRRRRTQA